VGKPQVLGGGQHLEGARLVPAVPAVGMTWATDVFSQSIASSAANRTAGLSLTAVNR